MTEKKKQIKTPKAIGQILSDARNNQKLTLEEISKKLCISKRHLKDLEDDNKTQICDVYSLGFLRSYSQFLGLDSQEITQQFKEQANKPSDVPPLTFSTPVPGKGIPTLPIIGLSIFALVGLFIGLKWYNKTHSTNTAPDTQVLAETKKTPPKKIEVAQPQPKELSPTDIDTAKITVSNELEPPKIKRDPSNVTLKVTEDAWIQIEDGKGGIVVSRIFKPEETYELEKATDFILKTGNAKGTQLVSGEKKLTFPDNVDPVQKDIPLNPAKWVDVKPNTH